MSHGKIICVVMVCIAMLGCGSKSSPPTLATGTWRAVMTSAAAQAGEQGEQAVLLVSLQQNGTSLTATVNNVQQESTCFPTSAVMGSMFNGKVILPGGEAISNLQLSGPFSSGVMTTLNMTGGMQSDANSAGGTFTLDPNPSAGCTSGGTFQMTRMPML